MNKGQLIDALAERLGDKKAAAAAVTGLVDVVIRTVNKGDKVTITGFGVFEKRARAARMARNPRTGESVKVKKTTVPAFRPGTQFREVVRGTRKLPLVGASPNGALTSSTTTAATTNSSATFAAKPTKPTKVIKPTKKAGAKETGAKATATGATATESPAKTAKKGVKSTELAKHFKASGPIKDVKPSKAAKPGKAAKPIKTKANKVAAQATGATNGATGASTEIATNYVAKPAVKKAVKKSSTKT